MNKIVKISIAGFSYSIDLDAHNMLKNYLKSLSSKYGSNDENEMVSDIEMRICELLNEKLLQKNSVITTTMVREIIAQIGTISSIERDSYDTQSGVRYSFGNNSDKYKDSIVEFAKEVGNKSYKAISSLGRIITKIIIGLFLSGAIALLITALYVPYSHSFLPPSNLPYNGVMIIVLSFCIGALGAAAITYRLIDRGRHIVSRWWSIIATFAFGIILGSIGLMNIIDYGRQFNVRSSEEKKYVFEPSSNSLVIAIGDGKGNNATNSLIESESITHKFIYKILNVWIGRYSRVSYLSDENCYIKKTNIYHRKNSRTDRVEVNIAREAYGSTYPESAVNLKNTFTPEVHFSQDTLYINNLDYIDPSEIYSAKNVRIDVTMPGDCKYHIIRR